MDSQRLHLQQVYPWKWMQSALRSLRESIYPPSCMLCQNATEHEVGLCAECRSEVKIIERPCRRCGAPLHPSQIAQRTLRQRCTHCKRGDWPADRIACLAPYDGLVKQSVIRMKQAGSESLGCYFGDLLADYLRIHLPVDEIDLVISVPQHWVKRIKAKHNSSELLATRVARRLNKPCSYNALLRTKMATKQGLLMRNERVKNIAGAYATSTRVKVHEQTVLVVDDIVTTGATAAAICRPLKDAGARRVYIAAVARGINAVQKATRA